MHVFRVVDTQAGLVPVVADVLASVVHGIETTASSPSWVARSAPRTSAPTDGVIATIVRSLTTPSVVDRTDGIGVRFVPCWRRLFISEEGVHVAWSIEEKHVVVTGGTSGIGRATAAQLARLGANVTLTSRSQTDAEAAADEIGHETGTALMAQALDLSSLASVREFATRYSTNQQRLDVLINNAGTVAGRRRTSPDGFEQTLAVNHLGPFLLTNLLTDFLIAGAPSRVITVSSENHRGAKKGLDFDDLQMANGYSSSKAYAASKLANIMFTTELDRRFRDRGITALVLHPGVVATNFGKSAGSPKWMGMAMTVLAPFLSTPEKGAATSVHLATAQPAEIDRGVYWSARKPKQPSPAALDGDAARRLWEASATLVGLPG